MDHLLGTQLGQYQLDELIGRGGMALVYKAYQPALDRYVAVKVLQHGHDPKFAARFQREALASARLQHPYILPVYDYGEQNGLLYLVLQYVENGATLHDMLSRQLAPARALRLASQVLDALGYAHRRGIVHRDVKPANILMREPTWPLLADFGIAKLNDGRVSVTQGGMLLGTAAYMAPEQAVGKPADARTDLYSMGVVLFEMLTGRPPFDAPEPVALLHQHVYEPLPSARRLNPRLPPAVEPILERALAKNPDARYQSAKEMAADLLRVASQIDAGASARQVNQQRQPGPRTVVLRDVPGGAQASGAAIALESPHARRRAPIAMALVLGLALIGGGGGVLWANQRHLSPEPEPVLALASRTATATATPSPTVAPSDTAQPTDTPAPSDTPAPTGTSAPSATPTSAPSTATAVPPTPAPPAVASEQINLRSGPGQIYQALGTYAPGTPFQVLGKNRDATWLEVRAPDGRVGWLIAQYLQVNADLAGVPVLDAPPPTSQPAAPSARPAQPAPAPAAPPPTAAPPTAVPPTQAPPAAPAPTEAPPVKQPKPSKPTRPPEPTPPRKEPTPPPRP